MALVRMRQETAIRHFEPVGSDNGMVDLIKSSSEARKELAIIQHRTREDSTTFNTTIFIRKETFNEIVNGTYCKQEAEPVGGVPKSIKMSVLNVDIIAKVTTKKNDYNEYGGYTVTEDLVGNATGDATFDCKFENGEWLMWHLF